MSTPEIITFFVGIVALGAITTIFYYSIFSDEE